jgi:polyisoprenoid-binding protein YceI
MIGRFAFLLTLLLSLRPAAAATRTFVIDSNASSVHVHAGKTGIGSFAGHEHEILARSIRGEVVADFEDLSRSSVEVMVSARTLAVVAEGEPEGDAPKVEQAMKGPQVLHAARFPVIAFRSRQVSGKQLTPSSYAISIDGEFSLHGAVKPMVVQLQAELRGDTLVGTGKMVVKQTEFGIKPTTAAGGLVSVEDEVTVTLRLVARTGAPSDGGVPEPSADAGAP